MLLAFEVLLTAAAWARGWKAWALLPAGIGILFAFAMGLGAEASGGLTEEVFGLTLILDFLVIVSLIVMVVAAPRSQLSPQKIEGANPL
jgi:uncharacterized membrane protein YkvI